MTLLSILVRLLYKRRKTKVCGLIQPTDKIHSISHVRPNTVDLTELKLQNSLNSKRESIPRLLTQSADTLLNQKATRVELWKESKLEFSLQPTIRRGCNNKELSYKATISIWPPTWKVAELLVLMQRCKLDCLGKVQMFKWTWTRWHSWASSIVLKRTKSPNLTNCMRAFRIWPI